MTTADWKSISEYGVVADDWECEGILHACGTNVIANEVAAHCPRCNVVVATAGPGLRFSRSGWGFKVLDEVGNIVGHINGMMPDELAALKSGH